jgi:hypothetical protein
MILGKEQFKKRRYNLRNHRNLEEGVRKKKTTNNLGIGKGGGYFNNKGNGNRTSD